MPPQPSVISLEFNELCPSLMARFIAAGELPNFQRFREESAVFETDAEECGYLLQPWVQWVTVHTGLSAREHGVALLSEGHQVQSPATWDLLSAAGKRVWVCGSMNPRRAETLNGYLLPDPWSTGTRPYPEGEFGPYLDYVGSAVQEHTGGGSKGSMKSFLRFMLGHGLSFRTAFAAARQVLSERFGDTRWRRARIMDLFQWDLFLHYYKKQRPDFATFFLNSTAHFQHCYWRNMEPEKFQVKPSEADQKAHARAILEGYKAMDRLVGRFLRLAGRDTTLVFSTALSQQPCLEYEETGGRNYYRLNDPSRLVRQLGLADTFQYEPVMAEQFFLRYSNSQELDRAAARLESFHVKHPEVFPDDRSRAFVVQRIEGALLVQSRCIALVPPEARLTTTESPDVSVPFYEVFYKLDTVRSGDHHPTGMLWVRSPDRRHRIHPEPVSIRCIAPTILRLFDLPVPTPMRAGPVPGLEPVAALSPVAT